MAKWKKEDYERLAKWQPTKLEKIKPYEEVHQTGNISFENSETILGIPSKTIFGDFGIQIANDGRIWICIDGIAFIRFHPRKN